MASPTQCCTFAAPVPAVARDISSRVMASHFADVADESSCIVANFVHGVAKQIIQSRCVGLPYKELLRSRVDLARLLSTECCSLDPLRSFAEAILQPLLQLRNQGRLFAHRFYVILVDGLCAGEMHKSAKIHTLSSFLAEIAPRLPKWMKLVVTVRTSMREVAFNLLPFSRIWFVPLDFTGCLRRIQHRKWRETKLQPRLQPSSLPGFSPFPVLNPTLSTSTYMCKFCRRV